MWCTLVVLFFRCILNLYMKYVTFAAHLRCFLSILFYPPLWKNKYVRYCKRFHLGGWMSVMHKSGVHGEEIKKKTNAERSQICSLQLNIQGAQQRRFSDQKRPKCHFLSFVVRNQNFASSSHNFHSKYRNAASWCGEGFPSEGRKEDLKINLV